MKAALPGIRDAEASRDVAVRTADRMKNQAASGKSDVTTANVIDAVKHAESIVVPIAPRLLADDATPEALSSLMAENSGRIASISDEGGIFDIFSGMYAKVPNLDALLKGHAGTPMRVDRKGRPPENIESPALTIGVMTQPSVMRQACGNQAFKGRGIIARFLVVLPYSYVGRRDHEPPPVPAKVVEEYCERIEGLAIRMASLTEPHIVGLTSPAAAIRLELSRTSEPELAAGGRLEGIVDWAGKYVGMAVRLAGLLHVAWRPEDAHLHPIGPAVMNHAVRLAEFFAGHYQAAITTIGADPMVEDARYVLGVIGRMSDAEHAMDFTRREMFNKARSRFPKVNDLDVALKLLEAGGWVRLKHVADVPGRAGRPPSPTYEINPAARSALNAQPAEHMPPLPSAYSADSARTTLKLSGS